jgi:cytochrome P450
MNATTIWKSGPSAAPLPPVATLQPVQDRVNTLGWYTVHLDIYQQFGPVVRLVDSQQERVVLGGPEANVFWSQAASDHVRMCDSRSEQNAEYGVDKTIVSSDGPEHSRLRKIAKHGYSRAVLEDRYAEMIGLTQRMTQHWETGQCIAVLPMMTQLFIQQLGCFVLNYAPNGYADDIRRFLHTVKLVTLAKRAPLSRLHDPAYCSAKARVFDLAERTVEAHRSRTSPQRQPDLIDDLLAAIADDGELFSERELWIAALTPYIGGLEVLASTCTFMLYALLAHPEALERVTAEVDAIFALGGPNPQTLKSMEQLYHALLETLRLYPVASLFRGTVTQPFELAGYRVEAEQSISICTVVPHFLPQIYPDPYRFDIDRYTKARQEHRQPGAFAPYGLGAHSCLGAGQAEVLIMLTIASLLQSVCLELTPAGAVFKRSENKLQVRVVERRAQL